MTHTLLKAGLVSLVLASPFALADSYNDKDGQVDITLSLKLCMQDTFYSNTHTGFAGANLASTASVRSQAIGSMYYQIHEGNDKSNFTFGAQLAASTQLNDALGATAFFDVYAGASDSTAYVLDGDSGTAAITVDHEYNFAPGVTLDYGSFGVGAKYLITTHKFGTVDIDEKQLMVGFRTVTSLDLDDSMSGLQIGLESWTTLRAKSSSAQTDYFSATIANGGINAGTSESYYNNYQWAFSIGIQVATM